MSQTWNLKEAMDHYRSQGAPADQQALVSLLREAQEENGGLLPPQVLAAVSREYGLKESFLSAVVKRFPSLRLQDVPHRLELCGGPNCAKRGAARLAAFLEREYDAKPGGSSQTGGFTLQVTGCMKNCRKGPNIKWDGQIYPAADEALLRGLICKKE